MTHQELRELDAWIAEFVFGWEWLAKPHNEQGVFVVRRAIFSCDPNWVRFNFISDQWFNARGTEPLFSDWDRCCAEQDDGKNRKRKWGLPHYTTDALMVLEKCAQELQTQDREETVSIGCDDPYWVVEKTNCIPNLRTEAPTLPLAICLFAKKLFSK